LPHFNPALFSRAFFFFTFVPRASCCSFPALLGASKMWTDVVNLILLHSCEENL
jgi:Na+-transporting NADH:ubiquinone oxidoreductase subunit NqrB